jgi:hypothetical protein
MNRPGSERAAGGPSAVRELPGSERAPYREAGETPLEALVRRGPAPPAPPPRGMIWRGFAVYGISVVAVTSMVMFLPGVIVAVVLINRWLRARHARVVAEVTEYARASAIPVERIDLWLADGGGLAGVALVLERASPLAEQSVRVTVPEASVSRADDGLVVRWTMDLPNRSARLIHLLDTLGPHREELGLVRVVCRRWVQAAIRPPVDLDPSAGQ